MNFILSFFQSLPHDVKYAIERGLDDIDISSKSDLDILIRKSDFPIIIRLARSAGILISVSVTYGGARIFLGDQKGFIKRVDFDWVIHRRGLPLDSLDQYIEKRYKDPQTGLYLLPEEQHAAIINIIKNRNGGAQKYSGLLEKYDYPVLNKKDHKLFAFSALTRHPFRSLAGTIRYFTCYLLRIAYPTGLRISSQNLKQVENNNDIKYLFQNRVSYSSGLRAYIDSRFLSRLCLAPGLQHIDIVINNDSSAKEITDTVIEHLRAKRTLIPSLLFKLA